jgi:predicted nuclease of predicted toxin-antitoxin system
MPEAVGSLVLDEDVSIVVAAILRARGFDALTARDAGRLGRSDAEQLTAAADAGRIFLTHNRADFEQLHRAWLAAGKTHSGILVARRRSPADIAARVGRILARLTPNELKSQLLYV